MNRRRLAALLAAGVVAAGGAVMLILSRGEDRPAEPPAVGQERNVGQVLRGRVIDGLGMPLRGCEVVLEVLRAPGSPRASSVARTVSTDVAGSFAVAAPASTDLALTLRPPDNPPIVARVGIRVAPGEELDLGDLAVPARPGITVRVARAEDGSGLPGAVVRLDPLWEPGAYPTVARGALHRRARSDDAGWAVMYGVEPGAYRITVEAAGRVATAGVVHHSLRRPAATSLALPLTLVLRGRVEGPGGAPVPGVRARVRTSAGGFEAFARGGPLGAFTVDGLSAEPHRLELEVPESGTWVIEPVVPGGDGPVLRLPEGRRLVGRVLGPERAPLAGARVEALSEEGAPLAQQGWVWRPGTFTAEDGSFRISGLPPGRYRLVASSEGLAPKQAGPREADGTEVSLVLEGPGTLTGKVLDPAGLPLQDAVIELLPPTNDGTPFAAFRRLEAGVETASARSERGGSFRLSSPGTGAFQLRITAREQAPLVLGPIQLDAGATRDLGVLKMPRAASIHGRALDDRGRPVAGADIHADPLPSCPSGTPGASGTSDENGAFRIGPLAPGSYEVFYHSPGEKTASQRARSSTRTRAEVRVGPGEDRQLLLQPR